MTIARDRSLERLPARRFGTLALAMLARAALLSAAVTAAVTTPVTAPAAAALAAPATDAAAAPSAAPTDTAPLSALPAPGLLERARRTAGAADRALRKENRPYIVAPLDSPLIRMRKGIEAAAALAPNAWYQAPKVEELVNNTGDGARRNRVITGNGTYCITERAPTTSIDMIEKHGKLRLTSCPAHEAPANPQEWRTAQD